MSVLLTGTVPGVAPLAADLFGAQSGSTRAGDLVCGTPAGLVPEASSRLPVSSMSMVATGWVVDLMRGVPEEPVPEAGYPDADRLAIQVGLRRGGSSERSTALRRGRCQRLATPLVPRAAPSGRVIWPPASGQPDVQVEHRRGGGSGSRLSRGSGDRNWPPAADRLAVAAEPLPTVGPC